MSPADLGEILKPFVFLDLHHLRSQVSIHPHSGLATITVIADGDLRFDDPASTAGEMLTFEKSDHPIAVQAGPDTDAVFVIGSAVPHAYKLHLGRCSVHTSVESLVKGEANIERMRKPLVAAGDRRQPSGNVPVFKD
jgi:hypothetical protein